MAEITPVANSEPAESAANVVLPPNLSDEEFLRRRKQLDETPMQITSVDMKWPQFGDVKPGRPIVIYDNGDL
ncbi:hypothetical protein [Streptomyces sp. NPDC001594]|uniref:hypothetical protein n=1 Tax=Streptomyces sp. NPDC001594 TaxID=3364590 RepID=UPI0036B0B1B1